MKRIFLALSLILSLTMVSAQPRTPEDAQKAITKAQAATDDAKKATKPDTWIKLAKAYVDAYDQPTKDIQPGMQQVLVKQALKTQQMIGTSELTGPQGTYVVESYADKDLYYNPAGGLEFFRVTKPAVEGDLLGSAISALEKAKELDVKGSKSETLTVMMNDIHDKIANQALYEYYVGNFASSAEFFKKAVECQASPVLGKVDSVDIYYAALMLNESGNKAEAIEYFKKCLDMGYYQEGNTFSNLADIYRQEGNDEARKEVLEEGFLKFPENKFILTNIINYYVDADEDTEKLFTLLHKAQEIDPQNPYLYYAEAQVFEKLKDIDNAAAFYRKSYEMNNEYLWGMYGMGALYYNTFLDLQEQAAKADDAQYAILEKQMEQMLRNAVEPFEIAFDNTKDPEMKEACARPLKTICFIFREEPEFKDRYEKYNGYLNSLNGE